MCKNHEWNRSESIFGKLKADELRIAMQCQRLQSQVLADVDALINLFTECIQSPSEPRSDAELKEINELERLFDK